jgi:hypothetical protein
LLWINLRRDDTAGEAWLKEAGSLDAFATEALCLRQRRGRAGWRLAMGAVVILRGVNLDRGVDPEDLLDQLTRAETGWLDQLDRTRLVETADRVTRYEVLLDAVRVVAALFLPLGFITGLLGINVGGMTGCAGSAGRLRPAARRRGAPGAAAPSARRSARSPRDRRSAGASPARGGSWHCSRPGGPDRRAGAGPRSP